MINALDLWHLQVQKSIEDPAWMANKNREPLLVLYTLDKANVYTVPHDDSQALGAQGASLASFDNLSSVPM
jgi:hypothetical protein